MQSGGLEFRVSSVFYAGETSLRLGVQRGAGEQREGIQQAGSG